MTVPPDDLRLELLTMRHAAPLEAFERDNRAFFAREVGDRGDDFFAEFADRLAERVAENDSGTSLLCVVVDTNGQVLGRVNLLDIDDPGRTELGYRVAESAQGRGVATWGVTGALDLAAAHGVRQVQARVATTNPASRRVLERCGFAATGPIDAPAGSTQRFLGYRKDL